MAQPASCNICHETSEAVVGAVTGSLTTPRTLLLGRYDGEGRFQYVGHMALARQAGTAGACLPRGRAERASGYAGWSFSAGWGSLECLDVTSVEPELVVEVGVGIDGGGCPSPLAARAVSSRCTAATLPFHSPSRARTSSITVNRPGHAAPSPGCQGRSLLPLGGRQPPPHRTLPHPSTSAAALTCPVVSFPSRRRASGRRTAGPRNARSDTAGKAPLASPPTPSGAGPCSP